MKEVEDKGKIRDAIPPLEADAYIAHADKEVQHIVEVWKEYDTQLHTRRRCYIKSIHS